MNHIKVRCARGVASSGGRSDVLRVVRLHVCVLQAVSTAAADSLIYTSVDSAAAKHETTTFFDTWKVRLVCY